MTPKSLPVTALLLATILSSCDDSSSSGSNSGTVLEGTWKHSSPPEEDFLVFTGNQMHRISYYQKCKIAEDWGKFTYASGVLTLTPDSAFSRAYQTSATDSATVCLGDLSRLNFTGTFPVKTTLENLSSSSFVEVTRSFSSKNGVTTIDTVRSTFVKQ